MQRIGLYDPYVHFRDPAWLEAAALYSPETARVVSEGSRVSDPDHVRVLRDDPGFVRDIDPAEVVEVASRYMLRLVEERGEELWSRFGVRRTGEPAAADGVNAEPSPPGAPAPVGDRVLLLAPGPAVGGPVPGGDAAGAEGVPVRHRTGGAAGARRRRPRANVPAGARSLSTR